MSWRALAYVETLRFHYDGTKLTLLEKMILDRIAYRHNGELRYAQVGIGYLQDQALCSRKSVIRAIRSCVEHQTLMVQRIKRESRDGRIFNETNLYFFTEFEVKDGSARGRELSGGSPMVTLPPSDTAMGLPPSPMVTSDHCDTSVKLRDHGGVTVTPKGSLQLKPSNPPPPTPSGAEGVVARPRVAKEPEKPKYFWRLDECIEVYMGRKSRLLTNSQQEALIGARNDDYVDLLRRNGFTARIVPREEWERWKEKSA